MTQNLPIYTTSTIQISPWAQIGPLGGSSVTGGSGGAGGITISTMGTGGTGLSGSPFIKTYQITEIQEDVLALSCAWYRIRKNKVKVSISHLLDNDLFLSVQPEDRELAATIRNYYKQKLVYWTLKEIRLTPFRQDLHNFVETDGKKFIEKILPLVFRLPEFYHYDIQFDELRQSFEIYNPNLGDAVSFTKPMVPAKRLTKNNKYLRVTEYWLRDVNNFPVLIVIPAKNVLQHLWDREFNKPEVPIMGNGSCSYRDGWAYLQLGSNWSMYDI